MGEFALPAGPAGRILVPVIGSPALVDVGAPA
jgi:hypothetical protein